MKKIFLIGFLSLLISTVYGADEALLMFKRTEGYSQLVLKNHGCNPIVSKTLVNADIKAAHGTETYLFIATNHNCKGRFRYEFMRTAALVEKSWTDEKVIIRERLSNIGLDLEKAVTDQ